MPEVMNCRRCKKLFMYTTGTKLCNACRKVEEEEFERVRKFLRDFPGATIQEVSSATEVSAQLIYRFLKEGRIEVAKDSPIALQCETCGVRITSGRFCVNCSKRLANEMLMTGKTLRDSLGAKRSKGDDGETGLRYLNEYRRDKKN